MMTMMIVVVVVDTIRVPPPSRTIPIGVAMLGKVYQRPPPPTIRNWFGNERVQGWVLPRQNTISVPPSPCHIPSPQPDTPRPHVVLWHTIFESPVVLICHPCPVRRPTTSLSSSSIAPAIQNISWCAVQETIVQWNPLREHTMMHTMMMMMHDDHDTNPRRFPIVGIFAIVRIVDRHESCSIVPSTTMMTTTTRMARMTSCY
jgi:hypothetical protein